MLEDIDIGWLPRAIDRDELKWAQLDFQDDRYTAPEALWQGYREKR